MSLDWYNKSRVQIKFDQDINIFREQKQIKQINDVVCKSDKFDGNFKDLLRTI